MSPEYSFLPDNLTADDHLIIKGIKHGHLGALQSMLRSGKDDVTLDIEDVIHVAAVNNSPDIYDWLIDDKEATDYFGYYFGGIDDNDDNSCKSDGFFKKALKVGNVGMVQHMLDNHALSLDMCDEANVAHDMGYSDIVEAIEKKVDSDRTFVQQLQDEDQSNIDVIDQYCEGGRKIRTIKMEGFDNIYDFIIKTQDVALLNHLIEKYGAMNEEMGLKSAGDVIMSIPYKGGFNAIDRFFESKTHDDLQDIADSAKKEGNDALLDYISNLYEMTDDVVRCITNDNRLHKSHHGTYWADVEDPTAYYYFDEGDCQLSEQSKNLVRQTIDANRDLVDLPMQEISVDEAQSLKGKSVDITNFGAIHGTGSPSGSFSSGGPFSFVHFVGLTEENLRADTIVHEFLGHDLGALEHPRKYQSADVGPFCLEEVVNRDITVMSYTDGSQEDNRLLRYNDRIAVNQRTKLMTELGPDSYSFNFSPYADNPAGQCKVIQDSLAHSSTMDHVDHDYYNVTIAAVTAAICGVLVVKNLLSPDKARSNDQDNSELNGSKSDSPSFIPSQTIASKISECAHYFRGSS